MRDDRTYQTEPYMLQNPTEAVGEIDIPITHESKPYLMVPMPDNATNGDMIKAVFDVTEVRQLDCCAFIDTSDDANLRVYKDWWNAPYKRRSE